MPRVPQTERDQQKWKPVLRPIALLFIEERMILAPNRAHFGGSCADARLFLARGWSLDQIPQPRKGFKGPINRHVGRLVVYMRRYRGKWGPVWLGLALVNLIRDEVQNAGRATNVIRHGLCPMLKWAREAVNPAAASFLIISVSL
jgi:hypothetical protein